MPYSYEIDRERRLMTIVFTGPLGCAGLGAASDRLRRDAAYDPEFGLLVDLLAADLSPMDAADLRDRAQDPPVLGPIAIVAGPGASFGLARMYELAGELIRSSPLAVFSDAEAARCWLLAGAPAPSAGPAARG
jgi:hypothetical protein